MENFKTKKTKIFDIIYILILLLIILLLIILPQASMQSFFQGIKIWATKVLPAMLPFFIFTKILSYTSFTKTIGKVLSPITTKLYGVGGVSGYIYIMSILSGYPVGAKLTEDFYFSKQISSTQAKTISAFTSTSGPLFVIGTVGIGFFASQKLGIIVLISHFISALLNGLLYRCKKETSNPIITLTNNHNVLSESMSSSISSILIVGGFIAVFYMLLNLLLTLKMFALPCFIFEKLGVDSNITTSIIAGLFEVTTGASMLSNCLIGFKASALILSFLVSFGGLSIHAQAYTFLKSFDMPYFKFFLQKLTHALLSVGVTFIILLFL